jgi:two-component system, chemotaxis family, protein-glutamate methylesterase/glutaminase
MTADPTLPQTRDVIVIGCSAGGVEALPRILQQLPTDLKAAVIIVQHMAATNPLYLVGILERTSRLPVQWAEQGDRIEHGRAIVAPPDAHLLLSEGHVQLTKGARENHARPSIDKLFRSAAAAYGSRVIGILLTGMLDDGVAGLRAIRDAGGVVIVQEPASAAFPELPSRALLAITPDRVLPIDAIGGAIASLVGEPVKVATTPPHLALEAEIDREGSVSPEKMSTLGPQTTLLCPECRGPMWQAGDEEFRRFRCYLGHATTARQLLIESADEVESALWSAVRALNDRATTLETLATDAKRIGDGQAEETYAGRARQVRHQAELARKFMLDLNRSK